jgi:hypothetical protein
MSPSVWWDDFSILRLLGYLDQKPPLKIWLDMGTGEPEWEQVEELRDALIDRGWQSGIDLEYHLIPNAGHNERAWAARVEPALRFLFPPR